MTTSLAITPMDGPLGARVTGIDLARPQDAETAETLRRAWAEHLLLVYPDQTLDDDQLIAFTRLFGELDPPGPNPYGGPILPDHPEINVISNVIEGGRPIGNLGAGEAIWHGDMTYTEVPPKGSVLQALELPPEGGNTYFANMYRAYEELDEGLKAEIAPLTCVHDATYNSAGMMRQGYGEVTDPRKAPGAHHPLVIRHPATGRPALFLGRRRNACIDGLDLAASEALLDRLWAHATQDRFATVHVWSLGDVLMWDNLATLHRRDAFDEESRRILHRTQIKGETVPAAA
ncbi:MAG: TauD/TfdA family dioxygenase [Alphaproteobacteria bacterium]|nr:TauD/TfdA family dioxygenase [Alphaproteobacteria bacterium]